MFSYSREFNQLTMLKKVKSKLKEKKEPFLPHGILLIDKIHRTIQLLQIILIITILKITIMEMAPMQEHNIIHKDIKNNSNKNNL